MLTTQYLLSTQKETPSEAIITSHQLMLKAGLVRKLASGLYTWLPTGQRVLNKVIAIIHQEMEKAGAQEITMPMIQPGSLWKTSKRWDDYGLELLRFQDRHDRDFVLGPTHEEVITDLISKEIGSYKQLPLILYQIQTKFRDEIRPRFGVMRSREFIMKDAYSFHLEQDALNNTYQIMHDAYCQILNTIGLTYRSVEADTGSIGGNISHEFHALADSGEDSIVFSDNSAYAANIEKAEAFSVLSNRSEPLLPLTLLDIQNEKKEGVWVDPLDIPVEKKIKTFVVQASNLIDTPLVAIMVRGDHTLNETKIAHFPEVKSPLQFASKSTIKEKLGVDSECLGPVNLSIPCIVDHTVAHMHDFYAGANQDNQYYSGINWERDATYLKSMDCRCVVEGDITPDKKGLLRIQKGIEVGHIFQLGTKYAQALQATVLNNTGKAQSLTMGCYGLGVTRIIAAIIEQNHDDRGIIWPDSIAPFSVVIIGLNMEKLDAVNKAAFKLYSELKKQNISVLLDDRKASLGIKMADMDLLGIPHRLLVTEKTLKDHEVEYKHRRQPEAIRIPFDDCLSFLIKKG